MNRIVSLTLLAGLFAALAPGVANADPITYGTTPFTGQATDLSTVGDDLSGSYTDTYGNVLDFTNVQGGISSGYGLIFGGANNGTTASLTLTLASGTTEIGFSFTNSNSSPGDYLTSATFSDGSFTDTFTGGSSYDLSSVPFMSFTDDRRFTTITLNYAYASSKDFDTMSGFTVAPTAVPEPVMAVNLVIAAAMGLGFRSYRRWLIATASLYDSEESGTPTPA